MTTSPPASGVQHLDDDEIRALVTRLAINPFIATSPVSAPNCWNVTDLLKYSPSELAASVARNAPFVSP